MKRRLHKRLWFWVVVSLVLHLVLIRVLRLPDEPVREKSERYEVKLLYKEPVVVKPETPKPREIRKKRQVERKQADIEEEQVSVISEEKQKSVTQEEEQESVPATESKEQEQAFSQKPAFQKQKPDEPVDVAPVIEGIRRRIEEELVYPYVARKKGLQGVVRLSVRLDEEGNLMNVSISKSSGHRMLDSAATALIEKIVPYPHGLETKLSLDIPIRYSLVP